MKALVILLLSVCGVVHAESLPPEIDNSMYPVGEASAVKPPSSNALIDMMAKLEQLQTDVRQLTGRVEEQANQITELKNSQATLYSDFDQRLQGLEHKSEVVKSAAVENPLVQPGLVEPEAKTVEPSGTAPQAVVPEVKPTAKQEAPPAAVDEKQQYQLAYDALRNGHTAQAIAQFNALLTNNPAGEYANNAQYWLGEAYRVNQDVELARKAFNDVIVKYPSSSKVPDALLKLGYIEVDLKNLVKAREYFTKVSVDYPDSTAARLAAKKAISLDDNK